MVAVANINELLDGHVTLDVECLDRVYLNAYVPNLQVSGQVVTFLCERLGAKVPSPALFNKLGTAFRQAVQAFADDNAIPVIRFAKDARKADVMRPYLTAARHPGVVAIGVAQEFQSVFTGHDRHADRPGPPRYAFTKADRRVSVFYFYIWDDDFGPGFIKVCTYFPYPAKVWVNGHEWAKRQAHKAGVAFTELANGFASCEDPDGLQAICDRLGPGDIWAFFERWMAVIPTPLRHTDRAAGYWWELSMRQVEVSRTLVFDAPRRARAFFESLVTDNVGIGRPSEVRIIFGRNIYKNTKGTFRTRVVTRGVDVCLDVNYRDSRIKEYLKEGRALRIETVVNSPDDLGVKRRLTHLDELQAKARAANARLLAVQKAGQDCAISTPLFERVALPSIQDGQRVPAFRFGDPRVMALAGALCVLVHTVVGFTNRSLCAQVKSLLDGPYTSTQTTYDLRRLRLKGLIRRLHGTNRYLLTPEGVRVAAFYTKLHHRLLEPLLDADKPPAPIELRRALRVIDHAIDDYITHARIRPAA
ncbi:MAG TPA: hypothetical protein VGF22_06995 [Acidimicrobiales bacterium]